MACLIRKPRPLKRTYRGKSDLYGDDVNTIVYSLWGDILNYNGEALTSYDLQEPEFISNLSYSEDGTALNVTIRGADGETERTKALCFPRSKGENRDEKTCD